MSIERDEALHAERQEWYREAGVNQVPAREPHYPFVCFCRNHPDNGAPTGRITMLDVQLGPGDLFLQAEGEGDFTYSTRRGSVIICGEAFLVRGGLRRWVGNWCWDGAAMSPGVLADLLNHLRRNGWTLLEADQAIWDGWERGEDVPAGALEGVTL